MCQKSPFILCNMVCHTYSQQLHYICMIKRGKTIPFNHTGWISSSQRGAKNGRTVTKLKDIYTYIHACIHTNIHTCETRNNRSRVLAVRTLREQCFKIRATIGAEGNMFNGRRSAIRLKNFNGIHSRTLKGPQRTIQDGHTV